MVGARHSKKYKFSIICKSSIELLLEVKAGVLWGDKQPRRTDVLRADKPQKAKGTRCMDMARW